MTRLSSADRERIIGLLATHQPLPATDRELLFPALGEDGQVAMGEEDYSGEVVPSDNWLCFSLYSTSLAVGKTYWPFLEKFGLTYPQFLALQQIRDGMTVNELGALLYLDSGTMTPLLKRLEAAGHIRRERDSKDERRVRLHLTAQGQTVRDESVETVRQILANASGWPRRDLRVLGAQISRFRATLLSKARDESSSGSV